MTRKKSIDFLTVTLFAGVLLTFFIYIFSGMLMDGENDEKKSFNQKFYSEDSVLDMVRLLDYKAFGHIDNDNIIVGKDEWLFEVVDSQNGYERLLDYIGGTPFDESEIAAIGDKVSERQTFYRQRGMEYALLVIPDSATVCSQKMPWYLGAQSENTRLSLVSRYMDENDISSFVNPARIMISESGETLMYNNTENSINAYGAYCIYNTAVSKYLATTGKEVDRIYREDTEFYTRMTEGKQIAQGAGLADTIQNKTVSLTDNMPDDYDVTYNEKGLIITRRISDSSASPSSVMVACSDSWTVAQLMPYFSSTFDRVYYKDSLDRGFDDGEQYGCGFVLEIIHEGDLGRLAK